MRPPTASKTVSRLSALKLVERHTEPGDARVVRVKLTKEGKRKAAAIDALWDEVEAELLEDFDNKDRKRLRKLLRRAAKNLAGITGADQTGFEAGRRGWKGSDRQRTGTRRHGLIHRPHSIVCGARGPCACAYSRRASRAASILGMADTRPHAPHPGMPHAAND